MGLSIAKIEAFFCDWKLCFVWISCNTSCSLFDIHVRLDIEIARRCAAIAEENIDVVYLTDFSVFHELVQIYVAWSRQMASADIYGEFVVDKDPNVVVAADAELEILLEAEFGMCFGAEVHVAASIGQDSAVIAVLAVGRCPAIRTAVA